MEKIKEAGHNSFASLKKKTPPITTSDTKPKDNPDYKLSIEKKSKELAQDLKTYEAPKKPVSSVGSSDVPLENEAIASESPKASEALKVEAQKEVIKEKDPAIFFISGFEGSIFPFVILSYKELTVPFINALYNCKI